MIPMVGPDFSSANLDKSILSGDLSYANFTNAHAHDINATGAKFANATMKNADFSFATLPQREISEYQKKEAKMFGVKFV